MVNASKFDIFRMGVEGLVLGLSGLPVQDVSIYVNGEATTKTDINGLYHLEFDKQQTVKIEAKNEQRDIFDSLKIKID